MGLPVLDTPRYQCELPSTGEIVEFRPFLVKEQKLLLMMKDEEEDAGLLEVIRQLLENVVLSKINIRKLPSFDIEYLFLQIRAKAVGETINLRFYCANEECDNGTADVSLNINDVKVDRSEEKSNDIKVSEDVGITFKYPNIEILQSVTDDDMNDRVFAFIRACGDTIYDEGNVYNLSDVEEDELQTFYESLSIEAANKITEFFVGMPTLRHTVNYKCTKCGTEGKRTLQGLRAFF